MIQVAGEIFFADCFGQSDLISDFDCSDEVFEERYDKVKGYIPKISSPGLKRHVKECLKRMDAARNLRNERRKRG